MAGLNIDELILSFSIDPKGLTEGEKIAIATIGRTKKAIKENADEAEAEVQRARQAIVDAARLRAQTQNTDQRLVKENINLGRVKNRDDDIAAQKARTAQRQHLEVERRTRDEKQRARRQDDAGIRQSTSLYNNARNAALGFAAAAIGTGAAVAFSKNAISNDAQLARNSLNSGISVRNLSTYQLLAQRNGGDANAAGASLANLSQQQALGQATGRNDIAGALQVIGGSFNSTPDQILQLAARFADKSKGSRAYKRNILGQLGLDDGLLNEVLKGSKQFNSDFTSASKEAVTQQQVDAATTLQTSLTSLEQAVDKAGKTVLYEFEPEIDTVTGFLNQMADKYPAATAGIAAFTVALGPLLFILGKVSAFAKFLGFTPLIGPAAATAGTLALSGSTPPSNPGDSKPNFLDKYLPSWARGSLSKSSDAGKAAGAISGQVLADVAKLQALGLTRDQAIGLAANEQAESGGNALAFNGAGGGHGAFGLFQWRGQRQADLVAFAKANGLDPTSHDTELAFKVFELRNKEKKAGAALNGAKSPGDAADIINRLDLRSGTSSSSRIANANKIDKILGPGPGPDPALASGSSLINGVQRGGMSSTGSGNSTSVSVGAVNVFPPNGDPKTIGHSVGPALKDSLTTQSNSGMF